MMPVDQVPVPGTLVGSSDDIECAHRANVMHQLVISSCRLLVSQIRSIILIISCFALFCLTLGPFSLLANLFTFLLPARSHNIH